MSVRIPRVTLQADYGEESSFGELSMLSLGYGFHQAWVYAVMFGTSSIFGIQALSNSPLGSLSLPFLISVAMFSFCLLFAAATDQKFLHFYVSKKVMTAGALLMCAGTVMLLIPPVVDGPTVAFEVLSGVATGIGSALLILFWGTAFSRCDSASIVLNTVIAIAVGIGIYAVVLHRIPAPFAGLLAAVLPLLELLILRKKTPEPFSKRNEIPLFNPLPVKRGNFVLKFGVPVLIFGLALGVLRHTSIQTIMPASTTNDQIMVLIAAGCAAVLILITVLAFSLGGSGKWNKYFRPLIPFIAITIFFLPLFASGNLLSSTFFLIVGYICFEALMWIFFGELSQKYRLSPVFVFGIGRGLLSLAALLGAMLSLGLVSQISALSFGEAGVALVLMLVMVIAYALLPGEKEIEAIVVCCPLTQAVYQGKFDKPETPKIPRLIEKVDSRAQHDAPEPERTPQDRDSSGPLDQSKQGRFRAQCEAIANHYLLSRRETEVLFFLAKGHNSAYIQEKLYISEGTSKTHIRHIYRKLNIHTQQELMRMVETGTYSTGA